MSGSGLYRRARFYAGNVVRAATIPWKQHWITNVEATTLFGCSYRHDGWHHLRKTLEEYDLDPCVDYRHTTLYRYLTRFTPSSITDVVWPGTVAPCRLPLFVYPWGTFRRGETVPTKVAEQSRFCGPSTGEFVAEEFSRTIRLYESIKRCGYRPWAFQNSFIAGTMLVRATGERRFVVLQGNHRLAILTHMGRRMLPVRDCAGYLSVVKETDARRWLLVGDGTCDHGPALEIFNYFFGSTGARIGESISDRGRTEAHVRDGSVM